MRFFGKRWDAPAFENAEQVDAPIKADCLLCHESIRADDSGVYLISSEGEKPVHLGCFLRSVTGSVEHLEGECSCHNGRPGDASSSYREQGDAVLQWLLDHGQQFSTA